MHAPEQTTALSPEAINRLMASRQEFLGFLRKRVSSPEAAEGGLIALVEEGDNIEINIPKRTIHLAVSDEEIAHRRAAMIARGDKAWKPTEVRKRKVTTALKAYAALTTSLARQNTSANRHFQRFHPIFRTIRPVAQPDGRSGPRQREQSGNRPCKTSCNSSKPSCLAAGSIRRSMAVVSVNRDP